MSQTTLVVMAAGIGSRYGGLKQVDPIGPNGEIILDYAAYDALKAGFSKIVFVLRRDIEAIFRDVVGRKLEVRTDVAYVFQELSQVPADISVPECRTKPWGTGHAVLGARSSVQTPFAVINADDFYGPTAYQAIQQQLGKAKDGDNGYDYCMVGYQVRNTLSEHGHVARGECTVTSDGFLTDVRERTRIQQFDDGIKYTENGVDWTPMPPDCIVSLNFWGFTPSIMAELQEGFRAFLEKNSSDLSKVEYFLPDIVGDLVKEGKARVKVLPTSEKWYGVTYQDDRPLIQAAIREMIHKRVYPEKLWEQFVSL